MQGKTSFHFAIFKRLQAATGNLFAFGQEHFVADGSPDMAGGFSLNSSVDSPLLNPYGLFGQLAGNAGVFGYPIQPGWMPLTPNNNDPTMNPLWALLNESLAHPPGSVPMTVPVTIAPSTVQVWPVMPPPYGGRDPQPAPTCHSHPFDKV